MTFRELSREFAVARKRQQHEANRDVTVAWHVVRLWAETKTKKRLPSLDSQLQKSVTVASPARLRATLGILSEQYGIPLRRRRKRKAT